MTSKERSKRDYALNAEARRVYRREYVKAHYHEVCAAKRLYYQQNHARLRALTRMRHYTNRDASVAAMNTYDELCKESAINMYTNGEATCRHCGQGDMDVLCIDHINDDGAAHRKTLKAGSGGKIYKWLRRNDYPEGFQVLCASCNLKKEVTRRREARTKWSQ